MGNNDQAPTKRDKTLEDADRVQVKRALWQGDAKRVSLGTLHHVLDVEHGKVDTYGGAAVGTGRRSTIVIDPPIPAALELKVAFNDDALATTESRRNSTDDVVTVDDVINTKHVACGGANKDTKKTRRHPKLPAKAKKEKCEWTCGSGEIERTMEPKIARGCL
ncbi:hypothetical protein PPTG_04769 [Phytophthora nicotianae INRA-310]|uniref:Uncharacterized protein n=1 Tax=Phytophthora nicotianae (strain INRA-310) TaxID=761204 RepID=W2R4L1_PHYN3|nr:hypothetical protein PPTG_04769 [Phytophthora nicotianae INRA-310]ETN19460.1 hypothetical protein PPTG_04769 [Phytophthora nicotianae INRA-310]